MNPERKMRLINAKIFQICKPGMKVINVARGGIIDEVDLLEALNSGKCGGAALDVFVTEPPKETSFDLVKHPKVLVTPHLGASTIEAQFRVAREISEQIVDAVNGKPMVGLVNAPALAESGNPLYQPWMQLAEKLGIIVGSLHEQIAEVDVIANGSNLTTASHLITTSFSCGLAKSRNPTANLINGNSVLKDIGTVVKSCHENDSDSTSSSISVRLENVYYTGVLSGNIPSLSQLHNINLVTPVALTENIITAYSDLLSPKQLMKLMTDIEVTSVSTGAKDGRAVIVATVEGIVEQALQQPLKFLNI